MSGDHTHNTHSTRDEYIHSAKLDLIYIYIYTRGDNKQIDVYLSADSDLCCALQRGRKEIRPVYIYIYIPVDDTDGRARQ